MYELKSSFFTIDKKILDNPVVRSVTLMRKCQILEEMTAKTSLILGLFLES